LYQNDDDEKLMNEIIFECQHCFKFTSLAMCTRIWPCSRCFTC